MATTRIDPFSLSHPRTCEVVTLRQLKHAGVSARRATRLCGPAGPWRRLHPGVVLLRNTTPSRRQRLHAALALLGPEAVITGADALRAHGMKCSPTTAIHVLVPASCRRVPGDGVTHTRTARLPTPSIIDGLRFAPPVRAALDLARTRPDSAGIRAALTLPLYWGLCDRDDLVAELEAGNQRGTRAVRALLKRMDDQELLAHGLAVRVLRRTTLPPPRWDMLVCDRRGRVLGPADAWWDEQGLVWQFRRPGEGFGHLALTATGIVIVRCTVAQLQNTPDDIARELQRAFNQASRTPRPRVHALRSIEEAA